MYKLSATTRILQCDCDSNKALSAYGVGYIMDNTNTYITPPSARAR